MEFWSLKVAPGKPTVYEIPEHIVLYISNASMVVNGTPGTGQHLLKLEANGYKSVICALREKTAENMALAISLSGPSKLKFIGSKKHPIFLTGHKQEDVEDEDEMHVENKLDVPR
eukprot:564709-Amorphochlora_amoeboformis.AAC.1